MSQGTYNLLSTREVHALTNLAVESRFTVDEESFQKACRKHQEASRASASPFRKANRISRTRADTLVEAIRDILLDAIEHGGTSLRDYTRLDGSEGQFSCASTAGKGTPAPAADPTTPSAGVSSKTAPPSTAPVASTEM